MPAKKKSKGRKSTKKSASRGFFGLLTAEQQKDTLAVGLLALALFTALALFPTSWLGERGAVWFPSGNPMGWVGAGTDGLLTGGLGLGGAAVPALLLFAGLFVGKWGSPSWTGRLAVFSGGMLLVLPTGLAVILSSENVGGVVGAAVAAPLTSALGWLGATLLVIASTVVLSVVVLRWNPLRTVGQGVAAGGGMVGKGLREGSRRVSAWWDARPTPPKPAAPAVSVPPDVLDPDPHPAAEVSEELPEALGAADEDPVIVKETRARPAKTEPELTDPRPRYEGEEEPLPTLDLLEPLEREARLDMEAELDRLGGVLVEKLRTFNVESSLGGRTTGPVVTQFEIVPAAGVKVNRIANLDADLALAMKAPSIRIVAPIPGKGAVGVEIPNPTPEIVRLREILQSNEFQRSRGQLPLGLGEGLTGKPYVSDLAKMPHLLIAGATGSGKSVCVNTIVTSLIYRNGPDRLRLLMIDPKMVELSAYADLPHLRHPVVTDPTEAAGVLRWAVLEMGRRYELLHANGVRSIAEFNKRLSDQVPMRRAEPDGEEGDEDRWVYDDGPLPYIVVVVDELADLMMQVQSEVERPLAQLAQKARAIGIHLIVATQRPSVNVITGLIKANFPTRIAFRVASKTDSRTILDQNGAEALLGNGDMLFLPPGQSEPVRIQGAFIATEETDRLISWYRAQEAHRLEAEEERLMASVEAEEPDILAELRNREAEEGASLRDESMGDWDELFREAAEVCIQHAQGSTSLLQRRLRVGYGRAARIVDQLHDAGVLGPPDGSKPREVLISLDELDAIHP